MGSETANSPLKTTIDEGRESQETFEDVNNILEPINICNGSKINLSINAKELTYKQLNLDLFKQRTQMINESVDTDSARLSQEREVKQVGVGVSSPISNNSSRFNELYTQGAFSLKNSGDWNTLKEIQFPPHL